jgi:hypothetical protein
VHGNEHDLHQPDYSICGGATSWRWWRTALTWTISLLDEDEQAWVVPPLASVTTPT